MRDAARSGNKRWALGNWDLRWKVTAVLAVPLAVAVGLGVSRISSEFAESNRLADIAENIAAIPVVTGLSAQTATTASSQMVTLAPNTSIVTDQNLADLDKAIANAEKSVDRLSSVPGARASLESMLNQAKAVRAQGKGATTGPASDTVALIDRVRNDSVHIVETTVGQVSDGGVDAAKLRLVDSLNTRAALVSVVASFPEVLRSQQAGVQSFLIASSTERALLNVVAHRFPDGDTSIADLRAGIDTRVALLTSPQAQAGQLPIGDLKKSLTDSLAVYEHVVGKSTKDIDSAMQSLVSTAQRDAWTYTAVVIATILAALLLAVFVARSMIVPLHRLRLAALRVAESDLPHEVAQLRNGASPEEVPLEPMPVRSTEEIGQLARAVDDIHGQALRLASDQAKMRSQVNDMFETLARRSKSLVDHQLTLIEAMEYDEKDPRLLENLFRLDHLAARMRRNGDNLLILAGTRQRRAKSAPVEIADVLRAAISEVEDYERVKLGATPRGSLKEPAASDLAHLFAELLDNALRASPPETDVKFTFAQAHDQGLLIEVADRGIGMPPAEMADINRRLEQTAEPGPDTARHMGLFVVGRLAERHGLTVRLRPTFDTARDPGVTVTVHVPVGLIVAGKPSAGQPVTPQPSPQAAAPQRPSAPSSMQMRAVTRTPGGNVMVTVDPGVSGPIPATSSTPTPSGPTPSAPAATGPGGLPQRQPGTAMSSSGMRSDAQQSAASLRPAPGQPAPSGPQRGKLAAANLPKRNLSPGGPPPRQPGGPAEQSGSGLPPREPNSGELPVRQPGANGVPQPSTGLPTRQPGSNGVPQRESASGGLPQRDALGGLPQRESASGGLPQRDPFGGLPQRDASSGLPQRESASGGLPQRDALGGLPQRESTGGLPQRDASSGLPQRESASGGLPQRDALGGLPQRESTGGLPQRDALGGSPQRESASGGLPQRDALGGLPQRESTGGLPQRDALGGSPQRESASGGLPQRDALGGLPQRESTGGLPQREPGSTGLPQRQPGSNGVPQRESAAGGPPQRDPGLTGLPPRQPAPNLPQRESASGGLPQREPGIGLPQRDTGAHHLPQRESANGLPQRESGSGALPAVNGLPQRDSSNGLPQREPGIANGLPQRPPAPSSPPQRESGLTGLPQRQPGAQAPQRQPVPPGIALPQRDRGGQHAASEDQQATSPGRDPGKHSFRSNPAKTASFFQTRLQPAEESGASMGGTPIFAEMMSAWLSDPSTDRSQVAASFESPGDEGWQAARRASEAQTETKTAAGLPQRNPGGRLVPGGVTGAVDRAPRRDPETIRSSLSRHQQGVRDGRAMRAMNLTGDKGDR
ncbi:HAMP domain-containing protein [Nocardia abscessus]|uniref:sensor histidine kinase n=1 Tax=Nocardia abscessus TaxID=120957 RepID=UPI00189488A4|nr:sensor histidine kinase [Nocardia abscessus]MBF6337941.1 HAMP domain-containing protein [Nocardia abscessus]